MNVVIFGQKWLAARVLETLAKLPEVRIAAVCPDDPAGSFAETAKAAGIPIVSMGDVPLCDMAVAAHCQRYIPEAIRGRCGLGVLAYHPSLLPRHRGRDAVRWTVAMREPIAGGTAYWMDDGADTGPIEAQGWCHVLPGENAAELWRRALAPMGVRLLAECVSRLATGGAPRARPQDERTATWEPAIGKRRLAAV